MHSPQLLLPLVKAKDQAGSNQEQATILDIAKKSSMGKWSSVMLCSHVATVKVPKDRNPCLTSVATEKKPASRFTKKGDNLRSTHDFTWWVMESSTSVDL